MTGGTGRHGSHAPSSPRTLSTVRPAGTAVPGSAILKKPLRFTGSIVETVEIAVTTHALTAGAIIKDGVAQPLEIAYKGEQANDPVTDVDRRSEAAIAETIRAHFPQHRILSEEGTTGGDDPRCVPDDDSAGGAPR